MGEDEPVSKIGETRQTRAEHWIESFSAFSNNRELVFEILLDVLSVVIRIRRPEKLK